MVRQKIVTKSADFHFPELSSIPNKSPRFVQGPEPEKATNQGKSLDSWDGLVGKNDWVLVHGGSGSIRFWFGLVPVRGLGVVLVLVRFAAIPFGRGQSGLQCLTEKCGTDEGVPLKNTQSGFSRGLVWHVGKPAQSKSISENKHPHPRCAN